MTTKTQCLAILGWISLVACGSNGTSATTGAGGAVQGDSFQVTSEAFDGVGQSMTMLVFTDASDVCALSSSSSATPTEQRSLAVLLCTGNTDPVGGYTVASGSPQEPCKRGAAWACLTEESSSANSFSASSRCDSTGRVTITSGAALSAATTQPLEGNLDIGFAGGSRFQGSFSLSYCSTLHKKYH